MTANDPPAKRQILVTADSSNRVALGRFGVAPRTKYRLHEQSDGSILLTPVELVTRSE